MATLFTATEAWAISYEDLYWQQFEQGQTGQVLGDEAYPPKVLTSPTNRSLKVTIIPLRFQEGKWQYRIIWKRTKNRQGSVSVDNKLVEPEAPQQGQETVRLPANKKIRVIFYSKPNGKGEILLRKSFTTLAEPDSTGSGNCLLDVRLCPDGSYVGRVPPACGFRACPTTTPPPPPPASTAPPTALRCEGPTSAQANQTAFFWTTGGSGSYSWSALGGSPASGQGTTFSTVFANVGNKAITVTSGSQSATCSLLVNPASSGSSTSTPPSASLTASLTGNGSNYLTANVGDTINYAWSSTGGTSFTSFYYINSPDTCASTNNSVGPHAWVASTASSANSSQIQACQAGRTYTITYRAANAAGQSVTAPAVIVTVRP